MCVQCPKGTQSKRACEREGKSFAPLLSSRMYICARQPRSSPPHHTTPHRVLSNLPLLCIISGTATPPSTILAGARTLDLAEHKRKQLEKKRLLLVRYLQHSRGESNTYMEITHLRRFDDDIGNLRCFCGGGRPSRDCLLRRRAPHSLFGGSR